MQTNEKNSTQPRTPSAAQLGQVTDLVLELHDKFDDGLREFQEAIHYAIAYLSIQKDDDDPFDQGEKKTNVLSLYDLASQLRKIEHLLPPKLDSYA